MFTGIKVEALYFTLCLRNRAAYDFIFYRHIGRQIKSLH